MSFEVDVCLRTDACSIDASLLSQAIERGLQVEGVTTAVISVTIVDNTTIHRLNREHLQHDYPTDVISFQLDWSAADRSTPGAGATERSLGASVEGEIVASAEYAAEMAARCGWDAQRELTLYVIHGMLHICGYDDLTPAEKGIMRAREKAVLAELGLSPQYPDDETEDAEPPPLPGGLPQADAPLPDATNFRAESDDASAEGRR